MNARAVMFVFGVVLGVLSTIAVTMVTGCASSPDWRAYNAIQAACVQRSASVAQIKACLAEEAARLLSDAGSE